MGWAMTDPITIPVTQSESRARRPVKLPGEKRRGALPKLIPDDATLKQVRALGKLHSTVRDCAAHFEVALSTFQAFFAMDSVQAEFEIGMGQGKVGLRRKQFEMAMKGNTTMLVWTGKNILGQTDRMATELTGKDGSAVKLEHHDMTALTDAQLAALAALDNGAE